MQASRSSQQIARRWASRLATQVEFVLKLNPNANPDNVRHTLILLELPPFERLQRSLIRGRRVAIKSKNAKRGPRRH
jgi:hypothetical protein